ncbi:MAG: glycerol-3-phosphate dehydrogenase, partial [Clostridiales Family XIII bacterium]|nr:glycerol-3-phosphate dehydrogenase [Clostridiales Family XIII bacterium]
MANIGIIGAGSWGSALGNLLAEAGHGVRIWDIDKGIIADIRDNGRNSRYLPGVELSGKLKTAGTDEEAVSGADIAL